MSAAPDWVIDLGHSRVKWGRASNGELLAGSTGSAPLDAFEALERRLAESDPGRVWLSGQSRGESVSAVTEMIEQLGLSLHPVRTGSLSLPVQPAYSSLGSDRWLALQWPWLQTRDALCVIDCGTAVTVDLVDESGRHRGGWILAGLDILRRGLSERAPGLPDVTGTAGNPGQPATDTINAIAGGTLLQLVGGIEQSLNMATRTLGKRPVTWLTGGDALIVADHLGDPLEPDAHLVLRGLAIGARA